MTNIIKFQKPESAPKSQGNKPDEASKKKRDREEIAQRIRAHGGEAIESLSRWRTGLPSDDRVRLAKNMDSLFREYKVKPGKLDWGRYGYQDKESFNRDLSRMRLPETAQPGRRLLAHNTRWLHLLEMVQQYCFDCGEDVTLEALAERLTRGTRFHPTKKIHSRAEKLLYSLKLWANEIDEQYGLLKTYRLIAEARAEHFEMYMRDYHDEMADGDFSIREEHPAAGFTDIPDGLLPLFNRRLESYTDNDWDAFLAAIPEDSRQYYLSRRQIIEKWETNFQPKTTLFNGWTEEGAPSLSWCSDTEHLPRWYIGFHDVHEKKLLSRYPEELSWPAIYSRKTGTLDPLEVDYAQPWEHYAYLTLYPNPEMSRIVPYLYSLTQELSEFCCLTEELLVDNEDLFFPPVPSDTEAVSKNIQNRVEEDYQSVREHWMNTADDLKSHPLLAWSEGRETMIDAEIERLTTGTGSSDKEREPNDS